MNLREHLASIWERVGPEIKAIAEAEVIEPFSCIPEGDWYYCDEAVIRLPGGEIKVLEFYGDDEPNWYHGFFLREEPVPLV